MELENKELQSAFLDLEKFKHSIYIQKLSSTTYINDCKDLNNDSVASHFGYENGLLNVWRAKLKRLSKWVYFNDFKSLVFWLSENSK